MTTNELLENFPAFAVVAYVQPEEARTLVAKAKAMAEMFGVQVGIEPIEGGARVGLTVHGEKPVQAGIVKGYMLAHLELMAAK